MKPRDAEYFAQGAHFAIAFSIPFFFFAALAALSRDILGNFAPIGAFFWLSLAIGGAFPLGLTLIFRGERLRPTAELQALGLTLLALWAARAALASLPFPARLIPAPDTVLALIVLAVQWVWVSGIEGSFRDRELLLASIARKDGHELYAAIRDDSFLVSDSISSLKGVTTSCAASGTILFLIVAAMAIFGKRPGIASFFFLASFFALAILVWALLRIFNDEQFYAGQGLASAFELTPTRIRHGAALLGVAALLSVLLSSDRALLSPAPLFFIAALIERFLTWLFSRQGNGEFDLNSTRRQSEPEPIERLPVREAEHLIDLRLLIEALKVISLIALVLAVSYFLFGSFFRRDAREFFREGKLSRYLRSFVALMRDFFARVFSGRTPRPEGASQSRAAFRESIRSRARSGKSAAKRREIGRLTEEYLKIVAWGDARQIPCAPSDAPLEYAERLARAVPPAASNLRVSANLFERALYSESLLTKDEEESFKRAVRAIVALDESPRDTADTDTPAR